MSTQHEEMLKRLENLKCINGAMYFGSVEKPCTGRDTGECCHNEQTYDEAMSELKAFLISERDLARKEAQEEYRQFILNILDGHDKANKEHDFAPDTNSIRFAIESRIIN